MTTRGQNKEKLSGNAGLFSCASLASPSRHFPHFPEVSIFRVYEYPQVYIMSSWSVLHALWVRA